MAFKWSCSYCSHDTTIVEENYRQQHVDMNINNKYGLRRLNILWIVCPNPECQKTTLNVVLNTLEWRQGAWTDHDDRLGKWRLLPKSNSKVFPSYIPEPIIQDYEEACAVVEASPKASATLSRRCLQGLIRDFWKVSKSRLVDEIEGIKDKVDPLTWSAIDAVRKVGNIGAHMEKDINLIIEVEPQEASLLINLIELLIKEWYIQRHEREVQLNAIIELSKGKDDAKKVKA
jgi:hypothetical protein